MKIAVFVTFLTCIVCVSAESQTGSPYPVLEQYLHMLNDGDLLTHAGWRRAALLFELPGPLPADGSIQVTTEHHLNTRDDQEHQTGVSAERIRIDENFVDPLGSIDGRLQFHPPRVDPTAQGTVFLYYLVFTDKHWSFGRDGKPSDISTGVKEWKIEGALRIREAARGAAIRYVEVQRDKSADPLVRQNADQTIKRLNPKDISKSSVK